MFLISGNNTNGKTALNFLRNALKSKISGTYIAIGSLGQKNSGGLPYLIN